MASVRNATHGNAHTNGDANGVNGVHHATFNNVTEMFRLDNRTVILTGGLGGLGTSLIKTLLQSGADVVCTDMPNEPPQATWAPLLETANENNRQLTYATCDVTDDQSVTKAFATAESTARWPVRGLVACAGISGRAKAAEYPIASFRKIIDVNVTGTFLCAQAAARIMQRQSAAGSMVLLASMSGTNVNRGVDTAAYNASKSAVLQLARNLAAEWGNDGEHPPIRVNTLSPGYIMTPITMPTFESLPGLKQLWTEGNMLGRLSKVEEHQSSVVYLLSDGSSYMTGSDMRVDGGHCAW